MSLNLTLNEPQINLGLAKSTDNLIYEFCDYRLDSDHLMLYRGDEEISLTPKQVETLLALVEKNGEIVSKDVLMERLWGETAVEESNLIQNIHSLRKVLGDGPDGTPMIETLRRRGYRFRADVTVAANGRSRSEPVASGARDGQYWYQERRMAVSLAVLGLIGLGVITSSLLFSSRSTPVSGRTQFAVLPLKPIEASNRSDSYEIGVADSLINRLSLIQGFVVRPLSATRKYDALDQDALAAGREQKVDYVLASNYQIAEGRIRITSQLFNVATGQIDATYKSESQDADLFSMQDTIAREIGTKLGELFGATAATGPQAKRGTTNEEAYRLYLHGAALTDKRDRNLFPKAIEYFEQAVRLDPNYALAYAKLANAHAAVVHNSGDRSEQYPKAKAAIEKALTIDATLSDAHAYLGEIRETLEWDFAGAERAHKRSIDLDPNSSTAHRLYAHYLSDVERHDEAVAEIKIAVDLDPASALNHQFFGRILLFARRYDEAIAVLERLAEMDTGRLHAHNSLSLAYRYKGDDDRAFEAFVNARTVAGALPDEIDLWKTIYARSGWKGILERQLEYAKAAEKNGEPNYDRLGWLSSELGLIDEAFAYLEKSFLERGNELVTLNTHPRYDALRGDPRFDDLVKRVGLK